MAENKDVAAMSLMELLETLTRHERKILILRFGFGESAAHTPEEVGKLFNVTAGRIRHIESRTLYKLSQDSRKNRLLALLDSAETPELRALANSVNSAKKPLAVRHGRDQLLILG